MDAPFLAMIMAWAANFEPKGWAYCDGRLLNVSQNTALFSLISTIYGGNGQTSFGLPDLRGRVPIGAGQSPGQSVYQLGQSGGSELQTLNVNQMPQHKHGAQTSTITVTPVYSKNKAANEIPDEGNVPAAIVDGRGTAFRGYGPKEDTVKGAELSAEGTVTIDPAGGSQPFDVRQPYLVINWVIALQGLYPTRD